MLPEGIEGGGARDMTGTLLDTVLNVAVFVYIGFLIWVYLVDFGT